MTQDKHALSDKQQLVADTLASAKGPMTAYQLLDQLRDKGFKAPPQIYRALDKLMQMGLAHKLESLNAFVTCHDPSCQAHSTHAFAICDTCGEVEELCDHAFSHAVQALAEKNSFGSKQANIELRGHCKNCK